jgi:hypothetical protein
MGGAWVFASRNGPGISYSNDMRNGIFRDDEGFDLLVDGVNRTFADVKAHA